MRTRCITILGRISLLIAASALALGSAELLLRHRFKDTPYTPGEQILLLQSWLQSDPKVGFLWKSDVDYEDGIRIGWADQELELATLSTDSDGFLNHPHAIANREKGLPMQIVALGDSFMQGTAYPYTEYFGKRRLTYYNLAVQRQCPPQYNLILETYALPLRPRLILYGVFFNDFEEILDFFEWQRSGLDWFTYHSGTWCGPPINGRYALKGWRRQMRGLYMGYRALRALLPMTRRSNAKNDQAYPSSLSQLCRCVLEARDFCAENNINFLLLLIPSKQSVLKGDPLEERAYTDILSFCQENRIPALHLRGHFVRHNDPAQLYNQVDAHWNIAGMLHTVTALEPFLPDPTPGPEPKLSPH